jgi:TonB-dependent receptor
LDTVIDGQKVNAFLQENLDSFRYDERRSRERSDPSTYQVEERVDALYGMLDFEVGKWRGILGLRQEETSISFRSNEVLLGPDILDNDSDGDFYETVYLGTTPTEGASQYDNQFSNAHFRYKWNDRTTFIASYTNTIKRPLYEEVVPYRHVRLEDREVEEGNPGLSPTLYENLDFSVDVRVGRSGLVSVELFDRSIEDFIFNRESYVVGGVYDGFELQRQENGSDGSARGLSLTWSQPISIPILPEGLSFNANYNALDTEIEYPSRPGEALPLTRSPDSELKLALKYETKKLFVQLKWDRETESIYRVASSPEEDRYVGPRGGVDISLSYKVQTKTRLYMELRNVTSEPVYDFYEGDPSHPYYYRIRPWTLNAGVKFEL